MAVAAGIAVLSYAWYRHFDRVMLKSAGALPRSDPRASRRSRGSAARGHLLARRFVASRTFIALTLRRSASCIRALSWCSAIGAGLVVNSVVGNDVVPAILRGGVPPRAVTASVIWTPFALVFVTARAVRMALIVPIEPRANWVFRMTETGPSRLNQLEAAMRALLMMGVAVPIVLMLPLQWLVLGPSAVAVAIASGCMGWLYVELLMPSWAHPVHLFAFGKGFVPQAVWRHLRLRGLDRLRIVVGYAALTSTGLTVVFLVVIVAAAAVLRHFRRRHWYDMPLEFEDALPSEINPLRLN